MHKLIEYVCDELDELERKVDKGGKLSASEMQYLDTLAHTKKNLLKAEEMSEDMEYSGAMMGGRVYNDGMSYNMGSSYARDGRDGRGGSYARGRGRNARRDSMGRYSSEGYSRASEGIVMDLKELMEDAPDERIRQEIQGLIHKVEKM